MSQRPNRHQRKPSQSFFVSFNDLSDPISHNNNNAAADNYKAAPSNRASPSQLVRAPIPPATVMAQAEISEKVAKDGEKPKNPTN
ncbi:hypothetical protein CRYUN_Cryun08bG0151100 [Craigia yunnanensis]